MKGFISNKKLGLTNTDQYIDGYASTYILDSKSKIKNLSLEQVKEEYNLKFNVLVADCEGYLEEIFEQNPEFYDELRMIIFEADYPDKCNYDKIRDTLLLKGFECKLFGHQNVYLK